MKRLVTLLALLALSALPALATEGPALPPQGPDVAVSASSCSLAPLASPAAAAEAAVAAKTPTWLSGEKPWIWTGDLDELFKLNQNCAQYCQGCGGCCAILGPGSCACC